MRTLAQSLALLLLVPGLSSAADEAVTKEATGEAAIIDGNKQKATEEAKNAALRNAVEQAAGTTISSLSATRDGQLIRDEILSNTTGYVSKWEPVGKPVEEAGVIKVTVRATVGTMQIDKDLEAVKLLVKSLGDRKLVVITQEQTYTAGGNSAGSEIMSTVLGDVFKADGWTMIDPHFAMGKVKLSASIGPQEVKEIGDLSKADYILYGNVTYRQQEVDKNSMIAGTFPVTGEYHLGLFATDSGSQLAEIAGKFDSGPKDLGKSPVISYERTAFDITKKRGDAIAHEVRAKALEYLRHAHQDGNRVVMNVSGLSDYAAVQAFKKVLADTVTGVRAVKPGTFGNGKAQFDVTFVGSTDDLAGMMPKKMDTKKVNVTGVTGNTLEVTVAK